jgi:hypothetical protein
MKHSMQRYLGITIFLFGAFSVEIIKPLNCSLAPPARMAYKKQGSRLNNGKQ